MSLFQLGDFTLHSGQKSKFKIECDALNSDDWQALAMLVTEHVCEAASAVVGIPRGGSKFAEAIKNRIRIDKSYPILIVDDVMTTGESFRPFEEMTNRWGVVAFSRGPSPIEWVTPLFTLGDFRA